MRQKDIHRSSLSGSYHSHLILHAKPDAFDRQGVGRLCQGKGQQAQQDSINTRAFQILSPIGFRGEQSVGLQVDADGKRAEQFAGGSVQGIEIEGDILMIQVG